MAIAPLGSPTTSTNKPQSPPTSAALDRDAFMKLLVAQLSHQDPLQPMQGTEFVTQLAQFSALEQAMAQSKKMDVVSTQLSGISANEATTLVGKQVTVRGKAIAFDGTTATGSSVTLGGPAAKVSVVVRDANGKAVRTLELGAKPKGALPIAWDGKNDAGQTVPPGSYTLSVSATGADGAPVTTSQDTTGLVTRISFEKGYPELVLDSGATAPISDLVSVSLPSKPLPTEGAFHADHERDVLGCLRSQRGGPGARSGG